jgi:hypothetical protein
MGNIDFLTFSVKQDKNKYHASNYSLPAIIARIYHYFTVATICVVLFAYLRILLVFLQ